MSTKTANYQMTKPDQTDLVDIGVLNNNFDIIDTEIKNAADAAAAGNGCVKLDGSSVMTGQLKVGSETTTVYTGMITTRSTASAGIRQAGFYVNSDGSSKFANLTKADAVTASKDAASLIFNESKLQYIVGSGSAAKTNDVYHTGNLVASAISSMFTISNSSVTAPKNTGYVKAGTVNALLQIVVSAAVTAGTVIGTLADTTKKPLLDTYLSMIGGSGLLLDSSGSLKAATDLAAGTYNVSFMYFCG